MGLHKYRSRQNMGIINSKMAIEKSKEVEIICSYSKPESKRPWGWGGVGFGVSVDKVVAGKA